MPLSPEVICPRSFQLFCKTNLTLNHIKFISCLQTMTPMFSSPAFLSATFAEVELHELNVENNLDNLDNVIAAENCDTKLLLNLSQ